MSAILDGPVEREDGDAPAWLFVHGPVGQRQWTRGGSSEVFGCETGELQQQQRGMAARPETRSATLVTTEVVAGPSGPPQLF